MEGFFAKLLAHPELIVTVGGFLVAWGKLNEVVEAMKNRMDQIDARMDADEQNLTAHATNTGVHTNWEWRKLVLDRIQAIDEKLDRKWFDIERRRD